MTEQYKERVHLDADTRSALFSKSLSCIFVEELAATLNCSSRTIRSWKAGHTSLPLEVFRYLIELSGIKEPVPHTVISVAQQRSKAGSKGGKMSYSRYGLGSTQSRQKGGNESYRKRRDSEGDIFTRHRIKPTVYSNSLAELMGIMIGDGCITRYQVSVSCNSVDDKEYVDYVADLMLKLFGLAASKTIRTTSRCATLTISSIALSERLVALGLPLGDKLRYGLRMPPWILADEEYARWCLRGIFDTDGGVYAEKHTIREVSYSYPRMTFVSASPELVSDIAFCLQRIGFVPTINSGRYVKLSKFTDIKEYFTIVGSSNPKHLRRIAKFGGVG